MTPDAMMIEAANRRRWMVLGATLPLVLGACAAPRQQMDASSPVAAQATAVSREDAPFPRFADIPAVPTDLRPAGEWARDVTAIKATGAQIAAETAPSTFSLNDTEGFAARTRARVADSGGVPDEAASRAAADAFTRAIRARATPPPTRR
jgi:hypothetical protein